MDTDDIEPRKQNVKPTNLGALSIDELNVYIGELRAEIVRAEDVIARKKAHRSGIEGLFGG